MRGKLTFRVGDPASAVPRYLDLLTLELQRLSPLQLVTTRESLTVRGSPFRVVKNWNLLVGISVATVHATPQVDSVLITYEIRVRHLLAFCASMSAIILAVTLLRGPLGFVIAGQVLVWGWIFGINYALTHGRFRRLLEKVGEDLSSEEQ